MELSKGNLIALWGAVSLRGEEAVDCLVRESAGEASLPQDYIRAKLKPCGALSYQMSRTDAGKPGCQHQFQFLYEPELPQGMVSKPCDGEVEEVIFKTLAEVQDAWADGEFRWNCTMNMDGVLLVRHGIVSAGDLLPTTSQARCFHGVKRRRQKKGLRICGYSVQRLSIRSVEQTVH